MRALLPTLALTTLFAPACIASTHPPRTPALPPSALVSSEIQPPDPLRKESPPPPAATPRIGPTGDPGPQCVACTTSSCRTMFRSTMARCAASIERDVSSFAPDVIVVPGGGQLWPAVPGCHTAQRAFAAQTLFELGGRRAHLLLSGRGPRLPAAPLRDEDLACLGARLSQQSESVHAPMHARRSATLTLSQIQSTRRAALTEADAMCSVILAQYPRSQWTSVLQRVLFEPDSMSTRLNIERSTPIIQRHRFQRVLVVSTMAFPDGGSVDNHARRAMNHFLEVPRARRRFRVGAVDCPYVAQGRAWSLFER